jgi:hypothetical protein
MGLGRALSKAASRVNNRGLKGTRDSQGNFTSIDMTDPNVQLKAEAYSMDDADLEQLASQLERQISSGDASQVTMLQERLDIVNEVLNSRLGDEPLSLDIKL